MRGEFTKGVFCLETDWYNNMKKPTTVRPILQLLNQLEGYEMPYIYRTIGTVQEFEFCVHKWTQKQYADYPILYLCFHGKENLIYVGDKRFKESQMTLERLGELLQGKCRDRIILFGSCSTLNTRAENIQSFLRKTRATGVFGYKSVVDWIISAHFELQVLSAMQEHPMSRAGLREMRDRIQSTLPTLSKSLTFRMEILEQPGQSKRKLK